MLINIIYNNILVKIVIIKYFNTLNVVFKLIEYNVNINSPKKKPRKDVLPAEREAKKHMKKINILYIKEILALFIWNMNM